MADEWGEAGRRYFLSDDKNTIQLRTYRKSDTLQIKPIKEIKNEK